MQNEGENTSMEYEELGRLENIIEKLLTKFNSLRQEKNNLEADLRQKDQELRELRETTTRLREEKEVIHERVTSLLGSLEKWEETQGNTSSPETPPAAAEEFEQQYPSPQGLGAGS